VLVLNRMLKMLKSVTKKLFGGKSSKVLPTDTLFQGCSTVGTHRVEMMKHLDPSLVCSSTCSQRDEVTFSFSYYFSNMKLLTSLHLIFRRRTACGGRRRWRTPLTVEDRTLRRRRRRSRSRRRRSTRWRGTTKGRPDTTRMRCWGVTDLLQDSHPDVDT
jgi:hypothetical protein